ncbi:hypothetical protein LINGRAHAP2_LOCUS20429 [Linum grandiflorum]
MWSHIRKVHSHSDVARQFDLEYEVSQLGQGDRDICSYYQAAITLWTEQDLLTSSLISSEASEEVLKERARSRLLQFLMRPRTEYEPIREETRLRSLAKLDTLSTASDSAFAVGRGGSNRPQFQRTGTSSLTCHFCHEIGHIQPHCKKKN